MKITSIVHSVLQNESSKQTKTNTTNIDKNTQSISSLLDSMSPSSEEDSQQNQAIVDDDPDTFNV